MLGDGEGQSLLLVLVLLLENESRSVAVAVVVVVVLVETVDGVLCGAAAVVLREVGMANDATVCSSSRRIPLPNETLLTNRLFIVLQSYTYRIKFALLLTIQIGPKIIVMALREFFGMHLFDWLPIYHWLAVQNVRCPYLYQIKPFRSEPCA